MTRLHLTALAAALLFPACLEQAVDREPPTVPSEVTATLTAEGTVLLTWSAAEDVHLGVGGYRLLRDGALLAVTGPAECAHADGSAAPGATYAYAVQAFDLASPPNASALSEPVQVTVPALAP